MTRSPQTIGEDDPGPGNGVRQATPCVSLHVSGTSAATLIPSPLRTAKLRPIGTRERACGHDEGQEIHHRDEGGEIHNYVPLVMHIRLQEATHRTHTCDRWKCVVAYIATYVDEHHYFGRCGRSARAGRSPRAPLPPPGPPCCGSNCSTSFSASSLSMAPSLSRSPFSKMRSAP